MKKKFFKCLAYSLTAAIALTFGACSSDEHYDVTGNPDNLVYLHLSGDNTRSFKVIHTPVSHIGAFDAKFPVNILRAAENPDDNAVFTGFLMSPCIGFTAEMTALLYRYANRGGLKLSFFCRMSRL